MNVILPQYWFCRRGVSDLNWIMQRMSVIPKELQQEVANEYERLYRNKELDNPRKAANEMLHSEAVKYRKR